MLDLLELELIIVTTKVVLALGPGPNRQEQKVLLTPKSSLQPPTDFLKDLCYYSILICVCVRRGSRYTCVHACRGQRNTPDPLDLLKLLPGMSSTQPGSGEASSSTLQLQQALSSAAPSL
jgi:hypothetical protein